MLVATSETVWALRAMSFIRISGTTWLRADDFGVHRARPCVTLRSGRCRAAASAIRMQVSCPVLGRVCLDPGPLGGQVWSGALSSNGRAAIRSWVVGDGDRAEGVTLCWVLCAMVNVPAVSRARDDGSLGWRKKCVVAKVWRS